ncbi:C40 family peptidase [Nocardia tengchongensis]|uniref:C40 family peptidase n=1 Tax=Nocardia tengchongensis TaxID=2055889 RepID=UPI0036B6BDE7
MTGAAGPAHAVPGLGAGLPLPQLNSRTLAAAAPVAMTGLMLAPMLLSALAGGGSGAGSGSAASSSPTVRETAAALGGLGDTYGTGTTDQAALAATAPGAATRNGSGATGTAGSTAGSATAAAAAEAQLYQRTVATSFHNLDVQLANYMARLAGSHGLDRAKLMQLLREMDVALAEVGTSVYTAAGRQRVHDILTIALQKGQYLVTGTAASAAETAAAIDQLTAQYVYNINGRDYTPSRLLPTGSGTAGKAISVALSELGKPYVYGATGPDSFDCSGLTQYAARAAGVQIPRTSQEQYSQLPSVTPANIRPGDLIFPSTAFGSGGPTHVMMYLGNGKCVEAPHTGAVVRIRALPTQFAAARWS